MQKLDLTSFLGLCLSHLRTLNCCQAVIDVLVPVPFKQRPLWKVAKRDAGVRWGRRVGKEDGWGRRVGKEGGWGWVGKEGGWVRMGGEGGWVGKESVEGGWVRMGGEGEWERTQPLSATQLTWVPLGGIDGKLFCLHG